MQKKNKSNIRKKKLKIISKFNKTISDKFSIIDKKRYNILNNKFNNSEKKNKDLINFFENNMNINSKDYVKQTTRIYKRKKDDPKLIAFYLPQFHTIPENDEWWGKGFTEWTNTTIAKPQFLGHYQPHLPDELGFYDLSNKEVFYKQIELAKKYGIYGFCFHYYWFSGKRLLEKPIFNYLSDEKLDFPFMLCWANEPWTRRWDASENLVLMPQKFNKEDYLNFIKDIMPFFEDSRYIKINNSPILIIYRSQYFDKEEMKDAIKIWRGYVKDKGFNDLYLVHCRTHGFNEDTLKGFNATVEFPPHNLAYGGGEASSNLYKIKNKNFKGVLFDLRKGIIKTCNEDHINRYENIYQNVFPSWDNTPRKPKDGFIFLKSSPKTYKMWLYNSMKLSENLPGKFVFINAWNEWAEGAHLEPDKKYGFAYLESTLDALMEYRLNLPIYDFNQYFKKL